MEYWIWVGTFGNGYMMRSLRSTHSMQLSKITMPFHLLLIQWVLTPPSQNIAACAAAHGTGHLATGALRIACGLEKTIITMRWASAARFQSKFGCVALPKTL